MAPPPGWATSDDSGLARRASKRNSAGMRSAWAAAVHRPSTDIAPHEPRGGHFFGFERTQRTAPAIATPISPAPVKLRLRRGRPMPEGPCERGCTDCACERMGTPITSGATAASKSLRFRLMYSEGLVSSQPVTRHGIACQAPCDRRYSMLVKG